MTSSSLTSNIPEIPDIPVLTSLSLEPAMADSSETSASSDIPSEQLQEIRERLLRECCVCDNLLDIDPQPLKGEWEAFVAYARASPSPECDNALGSCYYCGVGVEEDSKEACVLFSSAADQGNAQAQCKLGWCYEIGEGVGLDMQEAVRLYGLAAGQGHGKAEFNLGMCYQKGDGVAQNSEEAVRLFRLAAGKGIADAQSILNRMARRQQKDRDAEVKADGA